MTGTAVVLTLLGAVCGGLISWLVSYLFYRRGGSSRVKLSIDLVEVARIDPSTVGVKVSMKVGTYEINNLVLLELAVKNSGPHDLVVGDASDSAQHIVRPRVTLPPAYRALADPWSPDGSQPGADVRVARHYEDGTQTLFIHIHRLASGATSRARVLCTAKDQVAASSVLRPDQIRFSPGFVAGARVEGKGLLRNRSVQL